MLPSPTHLCLPSRSCRERARAYTYTYTYTRTPIVAEIRASMCKFAIREPPADRASRPDRYSDLIGRPDLLRRYYAPRINKTWYTGVKKKKESKIEGKTGSGGVERTPGEAMEREIAREEKN